MDRIFLVNDILKVHPHGALKRILWIHECYTHCCTVDLMTDKTIIEKISMEELMEDFQNGVMEISHEDPTVIMIMEEDIKDRDREVRDLAYKIVTFIAPDELEPKIFQSQIKRQRINEAKEAFGVGDKVIYKYLRKYWQSGKVKNALLPQFDNCGAKGKDRSGGDKKRGRPNYEYYAKGELKGINITDDIKSIFDISLKRHYHNTKEKGLSFVYRLMLKDFFTEKIMENGRTITKVMAPDKIPTEGQFKYYFYKQRDLDHENRSRKGKKRFELDYRGLPSDSTYETFGPGYRYQVDATIADVYLVSRINRSSIIGRPVVYLAVDVFSRMVTGIHVGLEGPSWNGMSSLLYNCMEDKVEFCAKFGIAMEEEDWGVQGIPRVVLGDRGELVGPLGEGIIENLNITIENTSSYRGDAKGIVEQNFRVINTKIKKWLPGEVKKDYRQRGERHYALDAKLDLYEFTQIIIMAVLNRNKNLLSDYPLTQEMVDDGVDPRPVKLWDWGIRNRSGNLKRLPADLLKVYLMRRGKASVTDRGIQFTKMLYSCERGDRENWYSKARTRGSWGVDIAYDNRDISTIYIIDKERGTFETCHLKKENDLYMGKTYEEVVDYHFARSLRKSELTDEINQLNYHMDTNVESIIKGAKKRGKESTASQRQKLMGIRENRKEENQEIRINQALTLKDEGAVPLETIQKPDAVSTNEDEFDTKGKTTEAMKKLRERRRSQSG